MKTAAKHILLFFIVAPTLYFVLFYAMYKIQYKERPVLFVTNNYYTWKGGDTYQKFNEFSILEQYDVVFLGSSRAYRGYSPFILEQFAFKSINLGTSGQSIKNSYFILKHYLTQKNCKTLILDIYNSAFEGEQFESSSDLTQNTSSPTAAYDIALHNRDIRSLNLAALRFFSEKDKPYYKSDDYQGKGYSVTTSTLSPELKKSLSDPDRIDNSKIVIDNEQLTYFQKLLDLASEKGIRVVGVYSPVSGFYDIREHNSFMKLVQPALDSANVKFYNYSKADSIITLEHFYDEAHLNQEGVERFNRQLFKQLIEDKIL